jgi:hypothetical protein
MASSAFQDTFFSWLDEALKDQPPPGVVAFSFNLAEPWCIEIIGAEKYSEDNSDWACDEAWRAKIKNLLLPATEFGNRWELVLEEAKRMILAYLDRPSPGAVRLRKAEVVAAGFVDGDLCKVWPRNDA